MSSIVSNKNVDAVILVYHVHLTNSLCARFDKQSENRCEVIQVSGEKNYCADVYYYERCPDFDNEADCWE